MSNTIDDRIETALKDTSFTDEHVRWLDGSLRDNMETCGGKAIHSLFLFGVFVVAWILLRSAAVGEISVMGVKIENAKIVALLLPVLAAYCLYAYHCFEAMAEIIHVARVRLYEAIAYLKLVHIVARITRPRGWQQSVATLLQEAQTFV